MKYIFASILKVSTLHDEIKYVYQIALLDFYVI